LPFYYSYDNSLIMKCDWEFMWLYMLAKLQSSQVWIMNMLYVYHMNEDDETMIHLHECMFYVHHIKFYPTAP
jgi:hypothetical protein